MSDPILETRSFQPVAENPPLSPTNDWTDDYDARDAIRSSALIHRVRWHTGLSQSEFASVYRIDPEYLCALERGEAQPGSALVAYLTVIDRAPEVVRSALWTL